MSTSTEVRRATRADVDIVADVLADAFAEDPVFTWLLPANARNRAARLRYFFKTTARSYLRDAHPIFLSGNGEGAAVWLPPGTSPPTTVESLRELLPLILVFQGRLMRASLLYSRLIRLHPRTPAHWYLYILGTRSASQGHGLGSAMLREVLDKADAAGDAAYLESSNIRNVPLYERHGFTVVEELQFEDGPTMWRMWRSPQA